jgi:hypothetical protein
MSIGIKIIGGEIAITVIIRTIGIRITIGLTLFYSVNMAMITKERNMLLIKRNLQLFSK